MGLEQAEKSGVAPPRTPAPSSSPGAAQAPMMWEAHSFTLAAGKDLGIPVPEIPKDSQVCNIMLICSLCVSVSEVYATAGGHC
jgi:hypothetical protein